MQMRFPDVRKRGGDLLRRRDAVLPRPAAEAPERQQLRHGGIEGAAARCRDGPARAQQLRRLGVDHRAVAVERVNRAALRPPRQQRVEPVELRFRGVERGVAVAAVDGEVHHRVHGEDGARLRRGRALRAAGEQQGEYEHEDRQSLLHGAPPNGKEIHL